MSLLLALCGQKQDLSVKEVPLSASAQNDVADAFLRQEASFREGEERPFDENWLNDGDEIATTSIPPDISVFGDILQVASTALEPVDTSDLNEVRGLAMKTDDGGTERILVQSFAPSQSLNRPWLVSLLFEAGTYTRLEASAFRLDNKLVCIVEGGLIKFRSLYSLGRVIDTSAIFSAATDGEVRTFAVDYANLFEIADVDDFVNNTSRNARKYLASIARSEALRSHTAQTLQTASTGTRLSIVVQNGKIVVPSTSGAITELMRFLNDGRYVGPISGEAFITNSRRPVT